MVFHHSLRNPHRDNELASRRGLQGAAGDMSQVVLSIQQVSNILCLDSKWHQVLSSKFYGNSIIYLQEYLFLLK